jgi:ATP-dependent DNA helicase PIF1
MFSHGQLYVAISRATARTNIKILALPPNVVAEEEEARRQEEKDAKRKQRARVNGMIRSKNKKEYYR